METHLETKQSGSGPELKLAQSKEVLDLFAGLQAAADDSAIDLTAARLHPQSTELKPQDMCFYQIKQLSYDKAYPHREAFENVLLSLDNSEYNFVYILTGTKEGIDLCIGVIKNQNAALASGENPTREHLSAVNYGDIAAKLFEGNFNGSRLEKLKSDDLTELAVNSAREYTSAGIITGIPSIRKRDGGDTADFQGIDRLINSMLGLEWRLVVVCEPADKKEVRRVQEDVYKIYNQLSMYAKQTVQRGENQGYSESEGSSSSESTGENWGYSKSNSISQSQGESRSSGEQSRSKDTGTSCQEGRSEGKNRSRTDGRSTSSGHSWGESGSMTIELANKKALELMKYMDEELLERLRTGFSRGLFKTSAYYMAKSPAQANRLKGGILSLFQGDQASYSPLRARRVDLDPVSGGRSLLGSYQNRYLRTSKYSVGALTLMGTPFMDGLEGLQTYLTAGEVSLLAGLPQEEVPGLPMKEGVSFGLNVKKGDSEYDGSAAGEINLGVMVQQGRKLENAPFLLPRKSLAKHTFIAGVTGSGKTTTCHRLLHEAATHFLVLEPAKTEYRVLLKQYPDLVVFTLGNESAAPFRINPFELVKGEVISAHIDMVKAAFTSAFPMEASMPQLLEEAIYLCYERLGWDIAGKYETLGDRRFPVLSDLMQALREVVKEKGFGGRLESEYTGSLISRLSNLSKGVKGRMLNCQVSTDFDYIAEHNVVLEMEELRSPEDKSLFMGFILSRLSAVIRYKHKENLRFRHITLVEEAHRLLSKVEPGDSGAKKAAVEVFTDLLAEVRKYGEGMIVVDQIPNKLAPEVLKNTNTKIIHKLLARDDKEAVGDTMLMDDKQKEYLSALEQGQAVVFSEQTDNPVHVAVTRVSDTSGKEIPEEDVKARFQQAKGQLGACYRHSPDPGLMSAFESVVAILKNAQTDQERFRILRDSVANAAQREERTEKEVWKDLLLWWDIQTGKAMASHEIFKERQDALLAFFGGVFCKPDFSAVDLPDMREHREFYTYLR